MIQQLCNRELNVRHAERNARAYPPPSTKGNELKINSSKEPLRIESLCFNPILGIPSNCPSVDDDSGLGSF
ncbi:hypothetical protein QQP08_012637 [Theobroma cacao]|nr:hypothetical protein QQP08_012637 [Theobroma cacao]